ncbi:hypothetical protein H0R92_00580 [Treponema sp. OMZ 840]|uniref:hypothetical protein n=1 Tax=Treponema sp. OMZ 840 TaxID=244313 RepID=UPI003D91FCF3
MTKKASFLFTALCLSLFVPVPPRLGFGLVVLLYANIIVFAVLFLHALIDYLNIKKYKNPAAMTGTLGITMLLYALLTVWSPIIAFTLGFIIYIIPVSLFMSNGFFKSEYPTLKQTAYASLKDAAVLSVLGILFFTIREILAYGTLSVPSSNGLRVITVIGYIHAHPVFFWATVPGALVILAGLLGVLSFMYRRYAKGEDAQ